MDSTPHWWHTSPTLWIRTDHNTTSFINPPTPNILTPTVFNNYPFLNPEDGTHRLSQNVSKRLPLPRCITTQKSTVLSEVQNYACVVAAYRESWYYSKSLSCGLNICCSISSRKFEISHRSLVGPHMQWISWDLVVWMRMITAWSSPVFIQHHI